MSHPGPGVGKHFQLGPDSKYFSVLQAMQLLNSAFVVRKQLYTACKQNMRPCPNKIVFTKTGGRLDYGSLSGTISDFWVLERRRYIIV